MRDTVGASNRVLSRSWQDAAHRLLLTPFEQLTAGEKHRACSLARRVGACSEEWLRTGVEGPNPHGVQVDGRSAAYVRFVVAVLHDFGPATGEELQRWEDRVGEGEESVDPRVEAFGAGFRSSARLDGFSGGADRSLRSAVDGDRRKA